MHIRPIAVAVRSKVWVCDRSFAGVAGSNIVFCVVRERSLRRDDLPFYGVW
jgi:hypothetical protein